MVTSACSKGQAGLVSPKAGKRSARIYQGKLDRQLSILIIITRSKLVTNPSRLTSAASNWNSFKKLDAQDVIQ